MRLFFAIPIPLEAIASITAVQRDLRSRIPTSGVSWTRPEQFHYTLKFLGEIEPDRAYKAIEAAQQVGDAEPPFELALAGVGAFPGPERPNVLWLGATEGAESVVRIANRLDAALARLRFRRENRPPTAHLTLARIKSYEAEAQAARAVAESTVGEVTRIGIESMVLMQSHLSSKGSEYVAVERFTLRKGL